MRKILIYAALALLTLGFTACQQEDDFALQEQEINLNITAGSVQTRVNTLEGGNVWENGDELYFCRVSKENQHWRPSPCVQYGSPCVQYGSPCLQFRQYGFAVGGKVRIVPQ